MSTITLNADNFNDTITSNDIVVVDFWAEWCGPCKRFAPVFEASSETHKDIVFGKVDTDDQRALGAHFNIRSIPTLMVFREQVLIFNQPGALPSSALEELITQVRALDMDDIRRQIAEHHAKQTEA